MRRASDFESEGWGFKFLQAYWLYSHFWTSGGSGWNSLTGDMFQQALREAGGGQRFVDWPFFKASIYILGRENEKNNYISGDGGPIFEQLYNLQGISSQAIERRSEGHSETSERKLFGHRRLREAILGFMHVTTQARIILLDKNFEFTYRPEPWWHMDSKAWDGGKGTSKISDY